MPLSLHIMYENIEMNKKLLRIIGVFIFVIGLVLSVQTKNSNVESSLLMENLESISMASGEGGTVSDCQGGRSECARILVPGGVHLYYKR